MLLDPIVIAIELKHPLLPLQALQFDCTLIVSPIWGKRGAKGVRRWVKFGATCLWFTLKFQECKWDLELHSSDIQFLFSLLSVEGWAFKNRILNIMKDRRRNQRDKKKQGSLAPPKPNAYWTHIPTATELKS